MGGQHSREVWSPVAPGPLICRILAAAPSSPRSSIESSLRRSLCDRWSCLRAGCAALLALAFGASAAHAFKPYTHIQTGNRAWEDVTDDGNITIEGREYPVRPEVVAALAGQPPVLQRRRGRPGRLPRPDLRPVGDPPRADRQVAQARPHARRGQAQSDPSYSAAEKSQILAFGYGYLTHAAGDMWAHTLINDVSDGVFPAVGEILTDVDDAEIAIRHLILEGYVGDATPGFDGNEERGPVPGEVNEDGNPEVSDDSTPGIPFAAPKRFIYETFINPANPLPGRHQPRPADRLLPRHAGRAAGLRGALRLGLRVRGLPDHRSRLLRAHQDADGPDRPRPARSPTSNTTTARPTSSACWIRATSPPT